jgi:hypothetical protein
VGHDFYFCFLTSDIYNQLTIPNFQLKLFFLAYERICSVENFRRNMT